MLYLLVAVVFVSILDFLHKHWAKSAKYVNHRNNNIEYQQNENENENAISIEHISHMNGIYRTVEILVILLEMHRSAHVHNIEIIVISLGVKQPDTAISPVCEIFLDIFVVCLCSDALIIRVFVSLSWRRLVAVSIRFPCSISHRVGRSPHVRIHLSHRLHVEWHSHNIVAIVPFFALISFHLSFSNNNNSVEIVLSLSHTHSLHVLFYWLVAQYVMISQYVTLELGNCCDVVFFFLL